MHPRKVRRVVLALSAVAAILGAATFASATSADDLAVDPAVGTGEEGDDLGDVLRRPKTLQRRLRRHRANGRLVASMRRH